MSAIYHWSNEPEDKPCCFIEFQKTPQMKTIYRYNMIMGS